MSQEMNSRSVTKRERILNFFPDAVAIAVSVTAARAEWSHLEIEEARMLEARTAQASERGKGQCNWNLVGLPVYLSDGEQGDHDGRVPGLG